MSVGCCEIVALEAQGSNIGLIASNVVACVNDCLAVLVGDVTGDGGSAIFEGDLIGEGIFEDRSESGCFVLAEDDIVVCRNDFVLLVD